MDDIKALVKENRQQLALSGIVIMALVVILIGILVWKLPVVSVCILVLLEAGLAVCLQDLPIWLHGAVLIAQLVLGLLFGNGMFLMVCAIFYVISILILSIQDK
ncbi:MAG: hypothetical protein IJZ23_05480 [Roseburia sp.]|nr:hypothetical protein [Roseburia sp.]